MERNVRIARARMLKSIHLIWRFRFTLAFFYDDFRKRKLLFNACHARIRVRFVNYTENGIEVFHEFANDRGTFRTIKRICRKAN